VERSSLKGARSTTRTTFPLVPGRLVLSPSLVSGVGRYGSIVPNSDNPVCDSGESTDWFAQ
jgi:hypothetical protein